MGNLGRGRLTAEELEQLCAQKGFNSLAELARKAGVHKQTIYSLQKGKRKTAQNTAKKVAAALDVPLEVLWASNAVAKKCPFCGNLFYTLPGAREVYCSRECFVKAYEAKAEQYAEKLQEIREKHPGFQAGEQNYNSKYWVIKSPTGEVYQCINLKHWCREHEDILQGPAINAYKGFTLIKYSMQGKTKIKSRSWHGWTLVDWGD